MKCIIIDPKRIIYRRIRKLIQAAQSIGIPENRIKDIAVQSKDDLFQFVINLTAEIEEREH